MSIRVDSSQLITGAVVVGAPGLGVLAESVPSTGEHGAGYLYTSLEFPADNGKEVRGLITTWPTLGTLTAYEDSSFEYDGPSDTFAFQMYVDGAAVGTPQTVTVTVGATVALGTPLITALTSDGFKVSVDMTGSGSGNIRLAVYPTPAGTPTYTIGVGWSGSPVYTDSETAPAAPATHTFVPDVSGLSASTEYAVYVVWDDGATTVGPVQGTGFTTASAGATYNDSLSESATLADSTAAANLLTALLAEAVTLLDASSNGSLYNEVLTVSVALSDVLTSTATLTGAVVESAALSDALNALATFQATLSESVAAGDFVATQADQATLPRKVLTARITALSFAARVEADAFGARVSAPAFQARNDT